MNQLIGIAFGGAFGSILRFLISSGIYQWLGRSFPYGTLTVNFIGSFLIGFLTEVFLLQRISLSAEYRATILVGVLGGLTTFSTFSLETIYLMEQGQIHKAGSNILINLMACLCATWIGLLMGRSLFLYSGGLVKTMGFMFPYALIIANTLLFFLLGLIMSFLLQKVELAIEHRAMLLLLIPGVFMLLSSLYLLIFLIQHGYSFEVQYQAIIVILMLNIALCSGALGGGLWAGHQL
jgi:CrcB protein